MNKPTLIILAAGMGSRYGGLKQLDTFSNEGDTLIDFAIYDAIRARFGKIVFVIRKNIETEFKAMFDEKLQGKIEVNYVFQEVNNLPEGYQNSERKKPWGTGHALLMAKDCVQENFAIINADDFYGKEAYESMAKSLVEISPESTDFNMVGYLLKNTLSENGHVSRGECKVSEKGVLTTVTERTKIQKNDGKIIFEDENNQKIPLSENTVVSMNFWGFTPKIFEYATGYFSEFLTENSQNLTTEFYLPLIVNKSIEAKNATVNVLTSEASWFGVTYSDDKQTTRKAIKKMKENGEYPKNLWA